LIRHDESRGYLEPTWDRLSWRLPNSTLFRSTEVAEAGLPEPSRIFYR